jgi:hypothetical protein
MVKGLLQASMSQIIDPKMLGSAWNKLPEGGALSYKLKF